ncbi:unnamed protein product, partial [Oikopleura dioica]
ELVKLLQLHTAPVALVPLSRVTFKSKSWSLTARLDPKIFRN